MILQEKPLKRKIILSQGTKFCREKRQQGSIFPYHPAIGYKWNLNLSLKWNLENKTEKNDRY